MCPRPPQLSDTEMADLASQLRDVAAFEDALPAAIGVAGDWPELTRVRRDALREVRRLAAIVMEPLWPRTACLSCLGRGIYLIDAEIDPDFQACRRCLTTGMRLISGRA